MLLNLKRKKMINEEKSAVITQKDGYVEIKFSKDLPKEAIKEQVSECVDETCECCSTEFRENVEGFEYSDEDGSKVKIFGKITKKDVEANVTSCTPKLNK